MSVAELEKAILQLPAAERLRLAHLLIDSLGDLPNEADAIEEGIRRMEDLASGKVKGLTAEEFWRVYAESK